MLPWDRLPARPLLLVRMLETALPVRVHLLQARLRLPAMRMLETARPVRVRLLPARLLLPEVRMLLCILVRIRMLGIPIL